MSALNLPLDITVFSDLSASTAEKRRMTLNELAALAESRLGASKRDLPLIKLGLFGERRSPKNSLRHRANMDGVSGVEGDYDAGTMTIEAAADALRAAGIGGVLYTSPSHTAAAPRWRVVCPFAALLPVSARQDYVGRLNALLGGVLAGESFTDAQAFYVGQTDGLAGAVIRVPGEFLDRAQLPAPVFPRRQDTAEIALPPMRQDQSAAEHIAQAVASVREAFARRGDVGRHQTVLATTSALASFVVSGHMSIEDAEQHVAAAMEADGRTPNEDEIGDALRRALPVVRPYYPPTGGAEFDELRPLPKSRLLQRMLFPTDCATAVPRGYLVKHLLAPGDVAALIGPPSTGKSVLAPHIAYAVAQGRRVFGLRTKPGRVLYAAAEDITGMQQRVKALYKAHGDAPDFAVVGIANLREPLAAAELLAAVAEWRPALVVIDTPGAAWAGLDENSSGDMGEVVALARDIARTGCAVLLIHHVAKHGDGSPRGHSVLNGTLDMCLALGDRLPDGTINAKLLKNRNGPPDRAMAFRIDVARVGTDEDGEAITAPIAAELSRSTQDRGPKLNRQQSVAWGEFLKLEAETTPDTDGNRSVSLQNGRKDAGLPLCPRRIIETANERRSTVRSAIYFASICWRDQIVTLGVLPRRIVSRRATQTETA